MTEKDLPANLLNELKSAAFEYQMEAANNENRCSIELFITLVRRCRRFINEIENAIERKKAAAAAEDGIGYPSLNADKQPADVFALIEKRENQLERLYREILRGGSTAIPTNLRAVLERHLRLVSKWHNFIITEEINFIFGGEINIPAEFYEKKENKNYEE